MQQYIERNQNLAHLGLNLGSLLAPSMAMWAFQASPHGAALFAAGANLYTSSSGALHWASSFSSVLCFISYLISVATVWILDAGEFATLLAIYSDLEKQCGHYALYVSDFGLIQCM